MLSRSSVTRSIDSLVALTFTHRRYGSLSLQQPRHEREPPSLCSSCLTHNCHDHYLDSSRRRARLVRQAQERLEDYVARCPAGEWEQAGRIVGEEEGEWVVERKRGSAIGTQVLQVGARLLSLADVNTLTMGCRHDTLAGARTKLQAAQQAESAADAVRPSAPLLQSLTDISSQALLRARQAVKEARAEIIALEREAEAEAKAAREKQRMVRSAFPLSTRSH